MKDMDISIFDFVDYKAYLKALFRANPRFGHGFKSKIAKALGCQTAYISQIINKGANFSLEQAEELNQLVGHSKDEGRYFLLLVQIERAGTQKLRRRLEEEREEVLRRRQELKERIEKTSELTLERQMQYYSHWYYSALHILTTIPRYRTKEAMSEALNLPINVVSEALNFLLHCQLLQFQDGHYVPGQKHLFLGRDSHMISKLHSNWRIKAIDSLDRERSEDLHFSTVSSLSHKDFQLIKEKLINQINEIRKVTKSSREETLVNMNLDFYSLIRESID